MKISAKEEEDIEVDMSPMIDMVFLLLIFFIVASVMIDKKVKVDIPTAAFSKVPEETAGRILVSVTKEDQIYIGQIPVSLQQLEDHLYDIFQERPDQLILIRADNKVKYKMNEKIMKVCGKVGAYSLIFSAFEQ